MLTVENLESVFERVLKATEGKYNPSRYIMRFNTVAEMLEELDVTAEHVNENTYIGFDVNSIKTPFIVSDYNKEDFSFIIEGDDQEIRSFINYITAK